MSQRRNNGKFIKGNKEGHRFTSDDQPDPKVKSEGRRKQIKEDNTIKAICNAFSSSTTPADMAEAFENVGLEADTKIKALIAKAFFLGLSKKAQIGDVIKLVEFIAKYTGQEPAGKSMLVDNDGNGINPFEAFYKSICETKDYNR